MMVPSVATGKQHLQGASLIIFEVVFRQVYYDGSETVLFPFFWKISLHYFVKSII